MPAGGLVTAAAISGAGSLVGGLLGQGAATKAGKQVVQGDQNAVNVLNGGLSTNIGNLANQEASLAPYTNAGVAGVNALIAGVQPGGQFTQTLSPDQILAQDPGYQFQLSQGEQQIQRAGAANGTGISGGELKDATTYSQNLAENAYQQAFNNFNQTQNQNFSRLLGITGIGQTAATTVNQDMSQAETNSLGINSGVAGLYQNEGQANAAATLGASSSINQMISGITGAASQGVGAYQLGQTSTPSPTASTASTLGLTSPSASTVPSSTSPTTSPLGVNYGDITGLGASSFTNGSPNSTALPYGY